MRHEYYGPQGGLMPNLGAAADATSAQSAALTTFDTIRSSPWYTVYKVGSLASAAACAYHGYKRNNGSIGWAIVWSFLGGLFFPITPAIAVAQGFGKSRVTRNRRRRTSRRN